MMISALVSALHLLALCLGICGIFLRGRTLRALPLDDGAVRQALRANSAWLAALGLWLSTGLARAFCDLDKGTPFYLHNQAFKLKLGLFVFVCILEVFPMVTLMRWRLQLERGRPVDLSRVKLLHEISHLQWVVIVCLIFVSSIMARGIGM